MVGPDAIVGLSTHSASQVVAAVATDATYIAVGPIFATATKDTGYGPRGVELVAAAARHGRPIVAIGGITLDNAAAVIAAGAAAVAVIGDLLRDGDIEGRVRAYRAALPERPWPF